MIKFEEHEGKLFRMLDEPVPLTPDAEMPCLVRLIQDDSPMGMYNRDMYKSALHTIEMCIRINSQNDINTSIANISGTSLHYTKYEVIGTPVEEGSAEWALYQMMHGKWVYNPSLEKHKSDKLDTRYLHAYGKFGQDIVVKNTLTGIDSILGAANISHWTNYAEPSGWQIYEPKPKPLLADAKVGDLCKHRNGDWSQIIDTNGTYIQVQPIRTTLKDTKGINRNFCLSGSHFIMQFGGEYDIIHTEPLAPEGSAEWAWQMAKLGIETKCIYGKIRIPEVCYNGMAYAMPLTQSAENRKYVINKICECSPDGWQLYKESEPEQAKEQFEVGDWVDCKDLAGVHAQCKVLEIHKHNVILGCKTGHRWSLPHNNIISKLKPSEIVVRIGCLSGTIGVSCHSAYFLMWHSNPEIDFDYSVIKLSALDTRTRELVESLLEAMRGEK